MNLSDALAARVAKRRETMLAARGWTDAELLAAVDAGATKAELSARFRVTWQWLRMILKANGRDTSSRDHKYTAEENAALAKMWKDGTPLGEIREKLGLTAGQLAGRVDRMGLPSRQRKVPATDAQITALLMEGLSNPQVAATLHVGRERVAACQRSKQVCRHRRRTVGERKSQA